PLSPSFPYTTLFRSVPARREEDPLDRSVRDVEREHALVVGRRALEMTVRDRHDRNVVVLDDGRRRPHPAAAVVQDRTVRVDVELADPGGIAGMDVGGDDPTTVAVLPV